jgi:glucosyl-3-phosphoglycerate phosphatase
MNRPSFKNTYFALRHGESEANVRGVIVSDPREGIKDENTLTKNGEDQVLRSVTQAQDRGLLGSDTIIYSSPFSRCKRTAEIAKDVLGVKEAIIFDDRLRERWFGDWEGTSNANYQKVWDKDAVDASHNDANGESVAEVVSRAAHLIDDLEMAYFGKNILLVSHGDTLQILQTVFEGAQASAHRALPPLMVAEIRKIGGGKA